MIFGAGMLQVSLIQTANKLGYYTIAIDPDKNAIGKDIADEFFVVTGSDFAKTLEIAKTNNIAGIVTAATDKPLLMMARIAEKLELPFPSEVAINNTINKFELKKILQKNNIPCAKGVLSDLSELDQILSETGIKYPVIIKPVDSSGSRGVFYCEKEENVINAYSESVNYSRFDKVLIEEYLEGPEISIEALVQDNQLYIIQITDKTVTPFPYNVEMGHIQPSRFYSKYYEEIFEILNKAINILHLNNCALHPEMKITYDGLKIVEIGPRLGGDFITSHLTPLSTGINMEEQLINIAVGTEIKIKKKTQRYSAVVFLDFLSANISKQFIKNTVTEQNEKISEFKIYNENLVDLPQITNSLERHGHIVFSSDSLEELNELKNKLSNGF